MWLSYLIRIRAVQLCHNICWWLHFIRGCTGISWNRLYYSSVAVWRGCNYKSKGDFRWCRILRSHLLFAFMGLFIRHQREATYYSTYIGGGDFLIYHLFVFAKYLCFDRITISEWIFVSSIFLNTLVFFYLNHVNY